MGVGRADKEQKKGEGAKGKRPGRQKGGPIWGSSSHTRSRKRLSCCSRELVTIGTFFFSGCCTRQEVECRKLGMACRSQAGSDGT
ncbi:uncharacterized protein CCOS01_01162 [Colletotrichum costaricense]|uniref:Uncharacterized protein n=1 Tax=Colletotrichum costaricense TaxID=1209916 RepID=A0AAI9ZAE5_9PEZI|nr:uncharacterized protein CCOS01_01162 [Colletotrichum costaricense]KAK1539848.1 hypothetical protein CCOS01_01162 [Colletotrichum costaricense]